MKANQYYAVVITGAGSGIGRLMALRIVEEGGRVAIWDINGEAAQTTADMANAQVGADPGDPKAIAFTVDVTDNAAVQQAAAETIEALGRVNVLINNAGVVSGAPFEDLTEAQIRRTFAVNVLSLFWTTKAFMPALKKQQRAAIVTVASAAGIVAVARQTDYAASKFAAVGFTNSLRSELKKAGSHIRTLTVCPYYGTRTPDHAAVRRRGRIRGRPAAEDRRPDLRHLRPERRHGPFHRTQVTDRQGGRHR